MQSGFTRRLTAVDALRGLVIVLMALDHTRDFFHVGAMSFQPTDLAQTTPVWFLTRWATHICAPCWGACRSRSSYFWLLHAMAGVVGLAVYGRAAWDFKWMPLPSMGGPAGAFPGGYGYPLWATYLAWLTVLGLMWPLCRRLSGVSRRQPTP